MRRAVSQRRRRHPDCCAGTGNRPAAAALLVASGNNLALCLMSLERWEAAGKALAEVLAIDGNNIKATERHVKVATEKPFRPIMFVTLSACPGQSARIRSGTCGARADPCR